MMNKATVSNGKVFIIMSEPEDLPNAINNIMLSEEKQR
jgi:hypothetical protein